MINIEEKKPGQTPPENFQAASMDLDRMCTAVCCLVLLGKVTPYLVEEVDWGSVAVFLKTTKPC